MKPKKVMKPCLVCGKLFRQYSSLDKFCSMPCARTDQKNSEVSRSDNPQLYARRRVLTNSKKRDAYACLAFGTIPHECVSGRHSHHIIYLSEGGPDRLWNLITVCKNAHAAIHADKKWQGVCLQLVNGDDWYWKIRQLEEPDLSNPLKVPTWFQKLSYLWESREDVKTTDNIFKLV